MQITITLPPDLEGYLLRQAAQTNLPLPLIVLQILRQLVQMPPAITTQWPEVVLSYEPILDFPEFESYRNELIDPQKIELVGWAMPTTPS